MISRFTPGQLWDLGVIVLVLYLLSQALLITYRRAKAHVWYRWVLLAIGLLFLISLLA